MAETAATEHRVAAAFLLPVTEAYVAFDAAGSELNVHRRLLDPLRTPSNRGDRMDLSYIVARRRVSITPELAPYALLLVPEVESEHPHWQWLATAPLEDLIAWASIALVAGAYGAHDNEDEEWDLTADPPAGGSIDGELPAPSDRPAHAGGDADVGNARTNGCTSEGANEDALAAASSAAGKGVELNMDDTDPFEDQTLSAADLASMVEEAEARHVDLQAFLNREQTAVQFDNADLADYENQDGSGATAADDLPPEMMVENDEPPWTLEEIVCAYREAYRDAPVSLTIEMPPTPGTFSWRPADRLGGWVQLVESEDGYKVQVRRSRGARIQIVLAGATYGEAWRGFVHQVQSWVPNQPRSALP